MIVPYFNADTGTVEDACPYANSESSVSTITVAYDISPIIASIPTNFSPKIPKPLAKPAKI